MTTIGRVVPELCIAATALVVAGSMPGGTSHAGALVGDFVATDRVYVPAVANGPADQIGRTSTPPPTNTAPPTHVATATSRPASTPTSTAMPPTDAIRRQVYVVVYDPLLSNGQGLTEYMGWRRHEDITRQTVDFFADVSDHKVILDVVDTTVLTDGWPVKADGFRYTEETYLAVMRGETAAHSPDTVDYNKIVNNPALDICGRANRGEIDEVWLYNGPYFGFYESRLVGPGAYWYNSTPVPGPWDCERLVVLMGPVTERTYDLAIHNFGHRTEFAMMRAFDGWEQNRTDHDWDRFGLVDALSPDLDYSGCGNIHYPPNGEADFDYDNRRTARSTCEDFLNYPELGDPDRTARPVTCAAWGCTHVGYLSYWFRHLPNKPGCNSEGYANSWWKYVFMPELPRDPTSACPR